MLNIKTKKLPSKLIYVGPNLSRARLLKYQVFIGGYPNHLDSEFEAMPHLKDLFVPISDMGNAVVQTQTKGTPLNKYYKQAMEV